MIVVIAVVVVATIMTAGAAAAAMGASGGLFATGGAVLTGTAVAGVSVAEGIAAAAMGGLVGNVAGQLVGNTLGVHQGFSFGEALGAGLGAGFTAGLGGLATGGQSLSALEKANTLAADARVAGFGAASAVGNYAGEKLAGQEAHFSWANVAAAAVSTEATSLMNLPGTLDQKLGLSNSPLGQSLVGGLIGGSISSETARLLGGQGANSGQIVRDAFGNALGNAAVNAINEAPWKTAEPTIRTQADAFVDSVMGENTAAANPMAANYGGYASSSWLGSSPYSTFGASDGSLAGWSEMGTGGGAFTLTAGDQTVRGYPVPEGYTDDPAVIKALYASTLAYVNYENRQPLTYLPPVPGPNDPQALIDYNHALQRGLYPQGDTPTLSTVVVTAPVEESWGQAMNATAAGWTHWVVNNLDEAAINGDGNWVTVVAATVRAPARGFMGFVQGAVGMASLADSQVRSDLAQGVGRIIADPGLVKQAAAHYYQTHSWGEMLGDAYAGVSGALIGGGVQSAALRQLNKLPVLGLDVGAAAGKGWGKFVAANSELRAFTYNAVENPGPLASLPNTPATNFFGGN